MNADMLLQHFDRISEAPDAVARLRRFILDLAVRGKLVEQDPNDEPAAELLKRIQAEKGRLVKEGKTGKQDTFVAPNDTDIPFQIPNTWAWVPATYPAYLISDLGKKVQTKDVLESGAFPVVDQGKIFIRGYSNDSEKVLYVESPIVLFGDHTRETKLIDFDFIVGADGVKLLQPVCLLTTYYYLALQWLPLDSRGYGRHFKLLRAALLPLPPLAEQHRIVAKVDELMALCDQLEAAKSEREARRDRLVAASLHRIGTAPAANDVAGIDAQISPALPGAARFHLAHLPRLTTRPKHIKRLRQTILNLAVRGRLVPQDKNDAEVRIALEEAFEVKRNMVRGSALPKRALPDAAHLSTYPFELPTNWAFVNFDHLAAPVLNALKAGPFGSAIKKDSYVSQGYKVYGQEQVIGQDPDIGDYYISEAKFNQLKSCAVAPGDLLISLVGTIGKVLVLPSGCQEGIINPRLIKLSLNLDLVNPKYVQLLLGSPWVREFLFAEARGTTMDVLNLTILRSLPIPLPPLAEQHRIVAKVDELMALCDQLESQLAATQTDSRRLLEAVLRDALEVAA